MFNHYKFHQGPGEYMEEEEGEEVSESDNDEDIDTDMIEERESGDDVCLMHFVSICFWGYIYNLKTVINDF